MEKLSEYLATRSMSAAEFARMVGISEGTVSRYRTGEIKPGLKLAMLIEDATGGEIPAKAWHATNRSG